MVAMKGVKLGFQGVWVGDYMAIGKKPPSRIIYLRSILGVIIDHNGQNRPLA